MNAQKDTIIVLRRTNYGEADRIVNAITKEGQKISLMVKGVRKLKSKLVAAAELFTISEVTYIKGKSELYSISSARIIKQHGNFLNDLDKVQAAYDIIKLVNKYTDDFAGPSYFSILEQVFSALDSGLDAKTVELWAYCNVLKEAGHSLPLNAQANDLPFIDNANYNFDIEQGGFLQAEAGVYRAEHVKLLKLSHSQHVGVLSRVNNCSDLSRQLNPFIKQFVETSL